MVFQYLEEESKLLQYALQKYKRELQAMETTFQVNSELADKELTEEERSVVTMVIIHKRHTKDTQKTGNSEVILWGLLLLRKLILNQGLFENLCCYSNKKWDFALQTSDKS